jgi:indolepyruvate ferredoxin oxidoreductase
MATALCGDAVATNVFMLGLVWQRGWIGLEEASLLRAIELNGAAVPMNKAAFAWGRQAALDIDIVRRAAGLGQAETVVAMPERTPTLQKILEDRTARLTDYQNAKYARRYVDTVQEIASMEKQRTGSDRIARAVAVSLYKLMAYKDEYEVARLFVQGGFFEKISSQIDGKYKLRFHLAPPIFPKRDSQGQAVKKSYGPWMAYVFRILAAARGLRGTVFDVFGFTQDRRDERAAIGAYSEQMRAVMHNLAAKNLAHVLELARLPQSVRGFGHVKERNLKEVLDRQAQLLSRIQTKCNLEP